MSEHENLIEEALRWANGHPNRRSSELMLGLVGALEAAAARQPTEDDRELRELAEGMRAAKEKLYEIDAGVGGLGRNYPEFLEAYKKWVDHSAYDHADTVLALLDRLAARAAVPDAATEIARNLANATALTGQDARVIAEAAVKVAAAGEIAEDHARCDGRLLSVEKHAERMEAERDAALGGEIAGRAARSINEGETNHE